jgi:hypothetical protein
MKHIMIIMVCVSWGALALLPSLSVHVHAVDKKEVTYFTQNWRYVGY